jgi:hypothetical protein
MLHTTLRSGGAGKRTIRGSKKGKRSQLLPQQPLMQPSEIKHLSQEEQSNVDE